MKATIKGTYEGCTAQFNNGNTRTSMMLNQFGEDDKVKITLSDGYVLPKNLGDPVVVDVIIRKGNYEGRPFVSFKTA